MNPSVKGKLAQGQPTVGSWVGLGCVAIAEIMCDAGLDWVAVDLEHGPTGLARCEEIVRVVEGKGRSPLVRLSSQDPVQIKRVMDGGAHGLIVPMVTSRAQLDAAHAAMHYPPEGTRGVGLARAQGYGAAFEEYRTWLREHALLVAQIEHADALPHLDAILAAPALDAYLIGPYDLSASLGRPGELEHPEVRDAIAAIRDAGARHGVPAGIHVVEPDPAALERALAEGFAFVAYGVDFRMVDVACRAGVAVARAAADATRGRAATEGAA